MNKELFRTRSNGGASMVPQNVPKIGNCAGIGIGKAGHDHRKTLVTPSKVSRGTSSLWVWVWVPWKPQACPPGPDPSRCRHFH